MKSVNIIAKKAKRDLLGEMKRDGFVNIQGQLEIFGTENGKVIHYDKGDNQVTIWAKHATMHLLTNENYTSHGTQRIMDSEDPTAHTATGVGEGTNKDGTLISGKQYFADNTGFDIDSKWSRSTITPDTYAGLDAADVDANNSGGLTVDDLMYPFAPTKMLFGTGFEWENWAAVTAYDTANSTTYANEYDDIYTDTATSFDPMISDPLNVYSNTWSGAGNPLTQTRTMNDIYSATLSGVVSDEDWAITGAIKDGTFADSATERAVIFGGDGSNVKTYEDGEGNEFLLKEYAGIGNPAYIYPTRDLRFFEGNTEIGLSADSTIDPVGDIENKITFTVVMPEQTGANANIFYPYNGYILKEAGLFADARLLLGNKDPSTLTGRELDLYNVMPFGIMYAKRSISPILKSHGVAITSRWTLYL